MNPSESAHATAIISVAVRPGCEDEHETWRRGIRSAAALFPGYVGAESFEPVPGFQDHWVHVLRFDSPASLHAWLASDARRDWLERGSHLFSHPQELQTVLGSGSGPQSVSAVFSQKIRPGRMDDFRRAHAALHEAMKSAPGFEALESFPPVPGIQNEWVDIARFRDSAALERWMESVARRDLVADLAPCVENASVRKVARGFDAWFPMGSLKSPAPKWKQALVVLTALYPTVMAAYPLVAGSGLFASRPALTLVSNTISVAVLNWAAMPAANALLRHFLAAGPRDFGKNALGLAGIAVWLAGWYLAWSFWPGR